MDRFVVGEVIPGSVELVEPAGAPKVALGRRTGRLLRGLGDLHERAQIALTLSEVLATCVALAAVGTLFGLLLSDSLPTALLAGAATGSLPLLYLRRRAAQVLRLFEQQLPASVDLLVAAVRAGHSLARALARVAAEAPEPTRGAVSRIVREIDFGVSAEEALARLAGRYPSPDMDLIVAAVVVQQRVGGSLPKVLELIAETTRQRVRLRDEVRSLTAQQRYSAYMLTLFPVVAFLALLLISPDYLTPLLEPGTGRMVQLGSAGLVVVAFLIMRRIGDVDL